MEIARQRGWRVWGWRAALRPGSGAGSGAGSGFGAGFGSAASAAAGAAAGAAWLALLDSLYPPLCRVCGDACADALACAEHRLPARPSGPHCGRCAAALPPALPDGETCAECRGGGLSCGRVIALGDYAADAALREWVLALKHRQRPDLARPLGLALGARWCEVTAPPARARVGPPRAPLAVFVSVPLHVSRRLERGYDQARLIADAAAEACGARVVRALRRSRATAPQGTPGPLSRSSNVRDAFELRERARARLAAQDVWIVDDVLTSGATVEECARVLRAARPRSVGVLCVARA